MADGNAPDVRFTPESRTRAARSAHQLCAKSDQRIAANTIIAIRSLRRQWRAVSEGQKERVLSQP
jgi:hypothetical protein